MNRQVLVGASTSAVQRYSKLLDELFLKRSSGALTDEEEERFAVALNDCRDEMSDADERRIAEIVTQRRRAT